MNQRCKLISSHSLTINTQIIQSLFIKHSNFIKNAFLIQTMATRIKKLLFSIASKRWSSRHILSPDLLLHGPDIWYKYHDLSRDEAGNLLEISYNSSSSQFRKAILKSGVVDIVIFLGYFLVFHVVVHQLLCV